MVPTSTPRVGSSKMTIEGSCASDLAMTTFCWLPPESSTILALRCSALIFSRSHPITGELVPRRPESRKRQPALGGELADIDVVVDHHGLEEAVQLAVLGDVGDAVVDRLLSARGSGSA